MKKLFITATDTDAGKTFMTSAMMKELADRRHQVLGYKPVAAGCEMSAEGLRNSDAMDILVRCTQKLDYEQVNPVALQEAVAPHLAAKKLHQEIDFDLLSRMFKQLVDLKPDYILTEGAGGWRLPLGNNLFLSDLAIQQQMSVILVVPVRLGCLNHARLTVEAIAHDGLSVVGWIANVIDNSMDYLPENIDALQSLIGAPLLGSVPRVVNPDMAARYLDLTPLF